MNDIKIILLCSTRFALPALRELAFFKMLATVAIPRHCDEWIENVDGVLAGTDIPVIELDKETFADRLREAIEENGVNLGLVMTFPYKIPSSIYRSYRQKDFIIYTRGRCRNTAAPTRYSNN